MNVGLGLGCRVSVVGFSVLSSALCCTLLRVRLVFPLLLRIASGAVTSGRHAPLRAAGNSSRGAGRGRSEQGWSRGAGEGVQAAVTSKAQETTICSLQSSKRANFAMQLWLEACKVAEMQSVYPRSSIVLHQVNWCEVDEGAWIA